MCKLSCQAMKLDVFRKIVNTKTYECEGKSLIKIDEVESPATRTRKLKQREQSDFNPQYMQEQDTMSPSGSPSLKSTRDNKFKQSSLACYSPRVGSYIRHFKWHNTNYLLGKKGYNGLKTGITEAAGPCLSASYSHKGHEFVVVLLNSKTMEARWEEVPQLIKWAKNYQKEMYNLKSDRQIGAKKSSAVSIDNAQHQKM